MERTASTVTAWLLHTGMPGGLRFNHRRYAGDDLTPGSIDSCRIFRIFDEIQLLGTDRLQQIAFMIDQSHHQVENMEAAVQTAATG